MLKHGQRGALAVGHRVDHFAAAVHAIAAGEVTRVAGSVRWRGSATMRPSRISIWRNCCMSVDNGDWPMAGTTMLQAIVDCESGTWHHGHAYLLHLHRVEQQAAVGIGADGERLPCATGTARPPAWRVRIRNRTRRCRSRRGDRGCRRFPRRGGARRWRRRWRCCLRPPPRPSRRSRASARSCRRRSSSSALITPSWSSPGMPRRCMAPRPTPRKMKSNSDFELFERLRQNRSPIQSETRRPCGESTPTSRRLSAARSLYSATP